MTDAQNWEQHKTFENVIRHQRRLLFSCSMATSLTVLYNSKWFSLRVCPSRLFYFRDPMRSLLKATGLSFFVICCHYCFLPWHPPVLSEYFVVMLMSRSREDIFTQLTLSARSLASLSKSTRDIVDRRSLSHHRCRNNLGSLIKHTCCI